VSPAGDEEQAKSATAVLARGKIHGPLREIDRRGPCVFRARTFRQPKGPQLALHGHKGVEATMMYTHVVNRRGKGDRSPAHTL
jgi:hypothetical protein